MMATRVEFVRSLVAAWLVTVGAVAMAQSAPIAYPVPFSTALAGNGVVGGTTANCSALISTSSGAGLGDGCPAFTAATNAPQGAAVDTYGNVYFADYGDRAVRIIYNGGANVAAMITAANGGYSISAGHPAPAPAPVVGSIYTIAGNGSTTLATLSTASSDGTGKLACANYAGSGADAINSLGDGCPATSAPIGPRDVAVDADGNLFLTDYTNSRIRVLCVNCAASNIATALIKLEQPGVTPVNGAMYTIAGFAGGYRDGAPGFNNAAAATVSVALFRSPTAAVVSGSDDVYIADNLNNAVRVLYNGGTAAKNILVADGYTPVQGNVYTIAGDDCVSAAVGKTGTVSSANACLITTPPSNTTADTATPEVFATAATNGPAVSTAWTVYVDASGNVYYSDAGNARVKVIFGGIAAPSTFPNTAYPTLQAGYVYTFAGQGTLSQSGVTPSKLALKSAQGVGGDANGNIFFIDYSSALIYETYAATGLTAIIGGGNANATPAAAAACNGGTTGPVMTDAFYNGCPLTQVTMLTPRGPLVADASGNLYFGDAVGSLLRRFSYNPVFPATAVGVVTATQPYAFSFTTAATLSATSFTLNGASAAGFSDGGSDTCTSGLAVAGGAPGTTCVANAIFSPAKPGLSAGAIVINAASGPLGASLISGIGTGAGLTVDPGTSTTNGTGLKPNGIAVDGAGNVLVTDTTSKSLLRYTGSTPATVASGFNVPSGVAIDGAGDLFIADSAANTITEIPITGAKFILTTAASAPQGLATDGIGRLVVADSGNNRVLIFGSGSTQPIVAAFTGLNAPQAVATDSAGNLYAADSAHIIKLTPSGVQTTVATSGATGLAVDAAGNVLATSGTNLTEYPAGGGASITLSSAFTTPRSLALDSTGNAYIADAAQAGYVKLQRTAASYAFTSSPSSTPVYLSSTGNSALTAPTFAQTDANDFSVVTSTSNGCSGAVPAGTSCTLTANFNPANAGALTDTVTISSNATNSASATLTLTGTASGQSTTTAFTESTSSLTYGGVQTLTATVSSSLGAPSSGTVNFYNNQTTLLGSISVSSGVAALIFAPPAGSYSVTAVFQPASGIYFSSTSSAKLFTVAQAPLTVTANSASKVANAPNPALTYSFSGFVNSDTSSAITGSPVETTSAATNSPLGSYPITITQGTLASSNYTFTFVNGTFTVTGSTTQTLTFGTLPSTTYGAASVTLNASASSQLAATYTVTGPAVVSGSTLSITGAGTVSVTANQFGNNTYAAATPVTQTFSVAQAQATVIATSTSRIYGAANPTLAYTINGFVNNDSQATATSGAPTETTTATTSSNVGTSAIAIAAGTLASRNYLFSYSNGILTIAPATLTLTAGNATRNYGVANSTFTGTITGAVNNDVLTESFSTTATTSSSAGTYAIVPSATGANIANYTTAVTNGTLTISKATPLISFTASATSGYFGATSITLTATLTSPTSGVPSQTVTFLSGTTPEGAGTLSATGVGTLATMSLPVGIDSITASYGGDANFATATSPAITITIAPPFSVVTSATALSFQSGYQEAQSILTVTPGGRTDTLTFACQGLPAKLNCSFSPASLSLTGLTAAQSVQLLISNSNATSSLHDLPGKRGNGITYVILPLAALLIFGLRRRRLPALLAITFALAASVALNGCANSAVNAQQSSGTYNFTVTVNSGSTVLATLPYTLTIP